MRRSLDGGETWTRIDAAGSATPTSTMSRSSRNGNAKTVLTSTPREIFASTDKGESWQGLGVGGSFGLPYCRGLALKADDPNTHLRRHRRCARSAAPAPSSAPRMAASSWQQAELPVEPNSPIWAFATHPADPGRVVACSHYGELYASR